MELFSLYHVHSPFLFCSSMAACQTHIVLRWKLLAQRHLRPKFLQAALSSLLQRLL